MKEFMNENRKPFYDIGEAEQKLILDVLYGRVEGYVLDRVDVFGTWFQVEGTSLLGDFIYRVVAKTSKPSINWDHISDEYNYLAVGPDGIAYLYTHQPHFGSTTWIFYTGHCRLAEPFKSLKKGNCAAEDSLISRDGAA